MRTIRSLCVAVLVAGAAIFAAPAAHAESACVISGQTPEFCSDKFLESIHSAFPVEKHDVAVNLGFEAVNLLLKHPNKKQFRRIVSDRETPTYRLSRWFSSSRWLCTGSARRGLRTRSMR